MPCRRISESRVRENRMHGLMREGRGYPLLSTLPFFSLIANILVSGVRARKVSS